MADFVTVLGKTIIRQANYLENNVKYSLNVYINKDFIYFFVLQRLVERCTNTSDVSIDS